MNVSVSKIVETAKNNDVDFEFYPTTDEIINAVRRNLGDVRRLSILDCGAGNGITLAKIGGVYGDEYYKDKSYDNLFVIEKSPVMHGLLNKFTLIGTDFFNTNLWNKRIDVTFCNPPYSEYEKWVEKIILESQSKYVYLVIPTRWKDSTVIETALKRRGATAVTIGTYSFENAERQARANVNLVFIESRYNQVDYFDLEFKDKFCIPENNYSSYQAQQQMQSDLSSKLENSLVAGGDYVTTIYNLYLEEQKQLFNLFNEMQKINPDLLECLSVDFDKIKKFVLTKLKNIDLSYWAEITNKLNIISSKLITKERMALQARITDSNIDFTVSNIHYIAKMCIEIVSSNIDKQVLSVYNQLIEDANVETYKSNQRVFVDNDNKPITPTKLSLRIIATKVGGIDKCSWNSTPKGLNYSGRNFLTDLLIIARNLGYVIDESCTIDSTRYLNSGEKWLCNATYNGKPVVVFEIKAYYNWNIHIKFNQQFLDKLNAIKGRLEGWLQTPQDIMNEFDVKESVAVQLWNGNEKPQINPFKIELKN